MTDARRAALVAIAEAAPQRKLFSEDELEQWNAKSAEFLRAFDPPTVLALLRDLAAAEARVLELQRHVAEWSARASQVETENCRLCANILALTAERDAARAEVLRMDAAVDRMKTERDAALGEMAAQINVNDSLHKLIESARNYIDPEEHPEWDAEATVAMVQCDETIDALQAENANLRARVAAAERLAAAVRDYENHHPPKGGWLPVYIATALAAFDATAMDHEGTL